MICRSSGVHVRARMGEECACPRAMISCVLESSTLRDMSSEQKARKRPDLDISQARMVAREGSCTAITGSRTSISQYSSRPRVSHVTSSSSLSLLCVMSTIDPLLTMWHMILRAALRSKESTEQSRPTECTMLGDWMSISTFATPLRCSVYCVINSRLLYFHTRMAPSPPPDTKYCRSGSTCTAMDDVPSLCALGMDHFTCPPALEQRIEPSCHPDRMVSVSCKFRHKTWPDLGNRSSDRHE
mmetsp:Transcript_30907/g.68249  ORF Transcript_30907/g.68249 Transcript_30907/m.68249 type:complete len:242 (+) Transcript_30907:175-900(+)